MKYAHIINSKVVNISVWDTPPDTYNLGVDEIVKIPEDVFVGVGFSYIEGQFKDLRTFPTPSKEEKANEIRADRDRMLADSDWTQLPDAPVDQAAWTTYRQALRDIPQQSGFPTDVEWPTI
jgi:hypothetical protein